MTSHTNQHQQASLVHLTGILSEYTPICDPEFDAEWEELERQFAELRLTLASE
jgi:hypothetical protein